MKSSIPFELSKEKAFLIRWGIGSATFFMTFCPKKDLNVAMNKFT